MHLQRRLLHQQSILEIGLGIPPQCYKSKNIAEINAGPRQSGIGGADYARRMLGIKSLVCTIPKMPGSDYSCGGIEQWGKKYGVKVTSIYSDPTSPDYVSLVLQMLATGADAVHVSSAIDNIGVQILDDAEQQDGAAKMKWTASTSQSYDTILRSAIDNKYWNDRLYVNAELAPLDEPGKDNQNWIAVINAYGGNTLRDSFSQAGYIAARVAVRAMLTIKNPADINRNTVTTAVENMPPYPTDLSVSIVVLGRAGRDRAQCQPRHAHRDGRRRQVEGRSKAASVMPIRASPKIEAREKKLGIKITDQVPLTY